ncbi:MAG TPA: prepilin peptidase [Pirellulales bacterium]|nr:prepilin peptidase [Pirellulales bacterium]
MNWILETPLIVRLAVLFLLGIWLGGFLNLGIYRLAYQLRSISPWSAALPAAPPRRITDRLPVVGWFGLRREAALHGDGFWVRPLVLELLTGALVAALYWWEVGVRGLLPDQFRQFLDLPGNQGLARAALITVHIEFCAHVCLLAFMIVASFIDLDEKTIPDGITIPGTLIGLLLAAAAPQSLLPVVEFARGPNGLGLANPRLSFLTFADRADWNWGSGLSLALGIGCLWIWCFGLMTRVLRLRRGWRVAIRLFWARLVRDPVTKWLVILGALGTLALVFVHHHLGGAHWQGLLTALVGMAIGGGLTWVVRIVASAILGREAMGFGDVTLTAMIGAFLGWQPCLVIFFLAPFGAVAIGISQWLSRRDPEIRYGPFLCLAALVTIVRWAEIWEKTEPLFALGWLIPVTLAICLLLMGPLLVIVRAIGNRLRGE